MINAEEYAMEVKDGCGCLTIKPRYSAELRGSLGMQIIPPAVNSDM